MQSYHPIKLHLPLMRNTGQCWLKNLSTPNMKHFSFHSIKILKGMKSFLSTGLTVTAKLW